jgi:hypothetical protein
MPIIMAVAAFRGIVTPKSRYYEKMIVEQAPYPGLMSAKGTSSGFSTCRSRSASPPSSTSWASRPWVWSSSH